MSEHVILVAVHLTAPSRLDAQRAVLDLLPEVGDSTPRATVESWWIAEDDRVDGSDCDSAVFVSPTHQAAARDLLIASGLHNPGGLGWPEGQGPTYLWPVCDFPGCDNDMSEWMCPNDKTTCLDHCGEDDH